MSTVKRKVALFLSMAMLFFVLSSGCANKDTLKTSSKEITLKWAMAGPGKQEDSIKVWDEFNKRLKKYIPDLRVEFEVFPMADYKQQFTLMQTSREKIDIANTYLLDYSNEVRNKTFLALDEYLPKYAPDLVNELPTWLWNYEKVKNKIYAVPSYQMMSTFWGIKTQKKLADKYLDLERARNIITKSNGTFTKEGYDVLEEYLAKLKQNNELGLGVPSTSLGWVEKGYEMFFDKYCIRNDNSRPVVTNIYNTPECKLFCDTMADWYKKGYIREDILSATSSTPAENLYGKEKDGYVLWLAQSMDSKNDKAKYGIDIASISLENGNYIKSTNAAGGNAVMTTCQNPEYAVKLLNLINSSKGKELYNLLVYGIEGEHYQKISDNKIQTSYADSPTSSDKYGLQKWIIGNTSLAFETQADIEGQKDFVFNVVNKSEWRSKLIGFTPDTREIQLELSQVRAIKNEFRASVESGSLANHEEIFQKFMDKLDKAGNKKIIAELQRQVDEFLNNQN